ncbi:hypothetical protein [Desertibacillus haloalkaliphilus]|nr:hypothetical protein [Desertibacillus haloalkaliphilus]MBU8905556.1 hypothetical protein [Desertibacillus haloalkaliphilus]
MDKQLIELAKEIVALDRLRDKRLEDLIILAGNDANEVLRKVQIGMIKY